MKKFTILFLAPVLSLLLACSQQKANDESANPAPSPNADTNNNMNANKTAANLSDDDKDFLTKAAQGGRAEVSLGEMAAKYGMSSEVKDLGERLVTDHTANNDKLKQLAESKGVTLQDGLSKDVEKDQLALGKKKGKDFDKAFMKMAVSDHESDIKAFQKEADKGQDSDVKNFAGSTLPTLQAHLDAAKGGKKDVKKEKK